MRLRFLQYIKKHVFVKFKLLLFISCCLPAIINDAENVIILQHLLLWYIITVKDNNLS